MKAPYP